MPLVLYYMVSSPPCMSILLTAKSLGLELDLKTIDLGKGEHLTPEFVQMNPMHQIPVLDDNGSYLTESRAILQYLVNAYGKDAKHENLYPKDPKRRYLVDKMLYFDMNNLYGSFAEFYYPGILEGVKLDITKATKLNTNLEYFEGFLQENLYSTGNEITIADFAIIASLSSMGTVHDMSNYSKICAYMNKCKANMLGFGYKEFIEPGTQAFSDWAKTGLKMSK